MPLAPTQPRRFLTHRELALACVCVGLLAVEVCLTRVFSIVLWYHFGFLAVSTALLGFAASGVYLALKPPLEAAADAGRAVDRANACSAGFAALAVVVSLWLVTQTTFDVYTIVQDRTVGVLIAFVLWITIPFFFLGLVISRVLSAFPDRVGSLYGADLIGSALGCGAAVWVLSENVSAQHVILLGAAMIGLGGVVFARGQLGATAIAGLGLLVPLAFVFKGAPEAAFPLLSPKSKPLYRVEHLAQEMKDRELPNWIRGAVHLKDGSIVEGEVPEGLVGALSPDGLSVSVQTDDGVQSVALADVAPAPAGEGLWFDKLPWSPFRRWSSLSRVDAFHWPFAHGPWGLWGVSERFRRDGVTVPRQKGITIDAWAMTSIMRYSGAPIFPPGEPERDAERQKLKILEYLPAATVHRIKPQADHIVCIGAGGGLDLLTAKYFGCKRITGVEINPHVIGAVREGFPEFSGHLYDSARHPDVSVYNAEGRHYFERTQDRYDIVQLSGVDTYSSSEAGTFALSENFLYTIEAFSTYLDHLQPGGVLTLTRWFVTHRDGDRLVSPEAMRLLGLARAALDRRGARTKDCVYFLMSKGFTVILVKPDGFVPAELETLDRHCAHYDFPVLYTPARATPQIATLTGERIPNFLQEMMDAPDLDALLGQSEFDVAPPVDDRPFYFEWSRLRHILDSDHYVNALGGMTAHGTLVLLFSEVALLGVLFVLWPLRRLRRQGEVVSAGRVKAGLLIYFTAIGLGFIVVEIILSQKFVLFLGHPFHALATILCSLLLFSGVGAALSSRFPLPSVATLLAAGLALTPVFVFDHVFELFLQERLSVRVLISVAIMAPVGLAMGIPFPAGIRVLSRVRPDLIPWAWGINGYTSVVGSVLAVLLGIELGFMMVLLGAAGVYSLGVVGYALMNVRAGRADPAPRAPAEELEPAVLDVG